MSSQGTGSDISRQEAVDLLHKVVTESIKVQAAFVGRGGVAAMVQGTVSTPKPNVVLISERKRPDDASLTFGLTDVVLFKYGDNRAFPGRSEVPGTPSFEFRALLCVPRWSAGGAL